jgi:hypothetical protein
MKELWTALVEILTPPSESGDTKCCTDVVAWAENPDDYRNRIALLFEKSDCSVIGIEKCATKAAVLGKKLAQPNCSGIRQSAYEFTEKFKTF